MKLLIIIWILLILSCFSVLDAQDFYKRFDKHLDTTLKYRYNISMVPMPADKYLLDSVNKFIEISKTNTKQFDDLVDKDLNIIFALADNGESNNKVDLTNDRLKPLF